MRRDGTMSVGEKMVWAASFVTALNRDRSDVGRATAVAEAWQAVHALRTASLVFDVPSDPRIPHEVRRHLGVDAHKTYEQMVHDADDARARDAAERKDELEASGERHLAVVRDDDDDDGID